MAGKDSRSVEDVMAEDRRRGHLRQGRPITTPHDLPGLGAVVPSEYPEAPSAQEGFASHQESFLASAGRVAHDTGLSVEQVIHDYWLVRCLYALSKRMPPDGVLRGGAGRWAFGGGTSLTTAWGFVRRYSEDIDGTLFVSAAGKRERASQRRACFEVAEWATGDRDITAPAVEGNRVLSSFLKVGDTPRYIKFETSIIAAPAEGLVVPHEISSLLYRRGERAWAEQHPEIGGFALPCVSPAWIAVNKLDALHRRAVDDDRRGLRSRGRDLYDLWALATQQNVAAEIRRRTPELWASAAAGVGRAPTPRPQGGYADSPAFIAGTAAYDALRDGYQQAVDNTVWGDAPKFETAVKTVRALDTGSG